MRTLSTYALCFFALSSTPFESIRAETAQDKQAQAEKMADEFFRKQSGKFYKNGTQLLTSTPAQQKAYIAIAKEVREATYKELRSSDFPPEVAAKAIDNVILNSPIIRDPCKGFLPDQVATNQFRDAYAVRVQREKEREKGKVPAPGDPEAEALVNKYICPDGKRVIAGLGLFDPKSVSETVEVPATPAPKPDAATETKPPATAPEKTPPATATAEKTPPVETVVETKPGPSASPETKPNVAVPGNAVVQKPPVPPSSLPNGTDETAKPSDPPSYGPSSPQIVLDSPENHSRGSAHTGDALFRLAFEPPPHPGAQTDRPAPEKPPEASQIPAEAAQNLSTVKGALDEKVAHGEIDRNVAAALLTNLRSALKTEPDLLRALGTVHESLRTSLTAGTDLKGGSTFGAPPSPAALSPATSSAATTPPKPLVASAGVNPPSGSTLANAPSVVVVGSGTAPYAAGDGIAKGILSKLAASNAPVPTEKTNGKTKVGEGSSLLVKSAMALGEKASGPSAVPLLPSKAFTRSAPARRATPKAPPSSINQAISQIAQLLSRSAIGDASSPRAIASTHGKLASPLDGDPLTVLALAGAPLENESWNEGFDSDFLGYGIGAFVTSFTAFLGGFGFWYRRRNQRSAK